MEQVVALHRQAFGERAPRAELRDFLTNVFFGHPWIDEAFPSLAYMGEDGALAGCLGVMPRPMRVGDHPLRAIVTHNFIVAPGQRSGLPAIQLARAAMEQGADLRLADENAASRRISEALGGKVVAPRSGRWLRVFRPTRLAIGLADDRINGGRVTRPVTRGLEALSALPDTLLRMLPGSPTRTPKVEEPDAGADASMLLEVFERHTAHLPLRPVYTTRTLGWLLETLRATRQSQELRVRVVGASPPHAVGWYVYYSRPGAVGRVLQIGSAPDSRRKVLDHLFADAAREGNVGLSGQIEPAWVDALQAGSCVLRDGRTWLVAHTSNPEVERLLATPDSFLSRLESEAWLHFGY